MNDCLCVNFFHLLILCFPHHLYFYKYQLSIMSIVVYFNFHCIFLPVFFLSTIFFRPSSFSILLFFLLYLCYLLVSTFLICTTQSVQCEQRRIKHAQVFSTAQYNGWLAASQLGLRKCVKLAATGNTVSAIECAPINVTFNINVIYRYSYWMGAGDL
jgi:hypothetical protein